MLFNSFEFIWLFPIVFIVCCVSRRTKWSNACLLLISYGLYCKWKPVYGLILFWVTVVTYFVALFFEKHSKHNRNKLAFGCGVILTLAPLALFKYYNFCNEQLSSLFLSVGIITGLPGLNWALPLGISFYTFQAVGYLSDVYHKRVEAERNWWNYMLFVSFFPQIVSGPISRAKDLLPQIKSERKFNYSQAVQGLKWLLWGMFLKVVMADRVGIYVDTVFNNYEYQTGLSCWLGSILYSFQIYGDFAGYSYMAIGVGQLLGFELTNNFRRPYLSQSVTDFWHRWHISLSTWLRDYVYIPLGGSRCGKLRNYWNVFLTFLVSGVWHGANWTFIIWGMIHGLFQIVEKIFGWNKAKSNGWRKVVRVMLTFIIVNLAWVFFRMPTLIQACDVINKMFSNHQVALATITPAMMLFIVFSVGIVVFKDMSDELLPLRYTLFHHQYKLVRWITYVVLMCMILTCGVFDNSQFIYANF